MLLDESTMAVRGRRSRDEVFTLDGPVQPTILCDLHAAQEGLPPARAGVGRAHRIFKLCLSFLGNSQLEMLRIDFIG